MSNLTVQPTAPAADGAWAKVPAGLHQCPGISSIEAVDASDLYPNDGPRFKIYLPLPQFLDDDNKPVVLFAFCSQKLNPKTKLWRWLTQLGYPLVENGPAFNLGQLIGRPCTVTVSISDSANGPRPKVTDLWPSTSAPSVTGAQQAAPAQAAAPAPMAEEWQGAVCATCGPTTDPDTYATSKGIIYCSQHGPRAEL